MGCVCIGCVQYTFSLCIGRVRTRADHVHGEYMLINPWKLEKMKMQRF
jgi:hypothetical protein